MGAEEGGVGWGMGEGPAGGRAATGASASSLSYVWGTKENFTEDRRLLFTGPTGLRDLSGLRKQMAFPELGFRETERTRSVELRA